MQVRTGTAVRAAWWSLTAVLLSWGRATISGIPTSTNRLQLKVKNGDNEPFHSAWGEHIFSVLHCFNKSRSPEETLRQIRDLMDEWVDQSSDEVVPGTYRRSEAWEKYILLPIRPRSLHNIRRTSSNFSTRNNHLL